MLNKKTGIHLVPLAILMALLSFGNTARAQSRAKSLTLQLTVVSDTDKQPVAGAACMLTDYGIFAITDADGRARLEKVPVGDAALSIQMLGFEDFTEMFRFRSDSTFTIRIQESTLALEEVVVTAKPSAAGSSTSSNIGRMAIDHLQATSLKDVMQLIPGQLMSSSDMTSEAKITIRSASDNSANNAFGTSIMVDGVPVSDNTSLGNAKKVTSLQLKNCNFTGNIPESYGNLPTTCNQLFLNGNQLKGVVPAAVQAHPKFQENSEWKYKLNILPQQEGYGLTLE